MYRIIALIYLAHGSVVKLFDNSLLTGITVESSMEGTAVDAYLGIPFAEPPVNQLRFRPPQPLARKWEGSKLFGEIRYGCYTGKEGTSEDCLYLNVYRPQNIAADAQLPVMVWIYGGGFTSGKVDMFNGTELAARNNVIVVVPAYRLGAFGFLASNKTYAESGTTGNWGFLDQQFALKWVQTNIVFFKGDRKKVLLFGHSAGAISIAAHLVSKESKGLFSSAILSSPTTSSDFFFQERSDSIRFSSWAAKTLARCSDEDDVDCLRSIPASRLVVLDGHRDVDAPEWASRLFPTMPWGLTIDGTTLEGKPLDLARLGNAAKVPVIIGVTEDEGSLFSLALNKFIRPSFRGDIPASLIVNITEHLVGNASFAADLVTSDLRPETASTIVPQSPDHDALPPLSPDMETDFLRQLTSLTSVDISQLSTQDVLDMAPALAMIGLLTPPEPNTPYERAPLNFFKTALKECLFACSSLAFADALRSHGNSVWFYNFALDVWADTPWGKASTNALAAGGTNMTVAELGAFHGSELPFIFNLFPDVDTKPNDLTTPSMLFKGFTGRQFCPANSFKRTVATQMGCLWANMAKCSRPQCESDNCGIDTTWESFVSSKKVLNIQNRGEFVLKPLPSDSDPESTEFLPSDRKCEKWNKLQIPFFKFNNKEMGIPQVVLSADSNANSANHRWLGGAFATLVAVYLWG